MSHTVELLRFLTCGSVDDGKSTLIGRLLYDSKQVLEDQYEAIERASEAKGESEVNLANLVDGLRAEREQGITIDVAYRYFATKKRRFIVADTPGHVQYTRNMVTGASTANLSLLLVDARKGIIEQTRRHACISSMLGIPRICLCINKMDLIDYSKNRYEEIIHEFTEFATRLKIKHICFFPIVATAGENVVNLSKKMPWHKGPPLLSFLENVHIANDRNLHLARLPIQWVIRPQGDAKVRDFRGYAGQVASGVFEKDQEVVILPSGEKTRIRSIRIGDRQCEQCFAGQSVVLTVREEIDIARGDFIVASNQIPMISKEFDAILCWMHDRPLRIGWRYLLKHATQSVKAVISELQFKVDVSSLVQVSSEGILELNEIGRARLKTSQPLFYDEYEKNRKTGSFILIDENTNATVAGGMIKPAIKQIPGQQMPEFII